MFASSNTYQPPSPSKRQRPHLGRLSSLLPSKWSSGRKLQILTVTPPDTPDRSLLNTPESDKRAAPIHVASKRRNGQPASEAVVKVLAVPSPLCTPTSARSVPAMRHPRSASDCYPGTTIGHEPQEVLRDGSSLLSVPVPVHRRSISCSSAAPRPRPCNKGASTGIWLCSPPTGKPCPRPRMVRASSTKSNEGRAKALDRAGFKIPPTSVEETEAQENCMSAHRAVTSPSVPAEPTGRRSLDGDIAAGIYRLEIEQPRPPPVAPQPSPRYYGLGLSLQPHATSLPATPVVSAH